MNVNLIYKQTGYSFQITQFTALSFIYEVTNKVFRIPLESFKLYYKDQYIPNTQTKASEYLKKFPIVINVLEIKKQNHRNEKSKTNDEKLLNETFSLSSSDKPKHKKKNFIKCQICVKKNSIFYCRNCNQFICFECNLRFPEHFGHKKISLESGDLILCFEDYRNSVLEQLNELNNAFKFSSENIYTEKKRCEFFDYLIETLKELDKKTQILTIMGTAYKCTNELLYSFNKELREIEPPKYKEETINSFGLVNEKELEIHNYVNFVNLQILKSKFNKKMTIFFNEVKKIFTDLMSEINHKLHDSLYLKEKDYNDLVLYNKEKYNEQKDSSSESIRSHSNSKSHSNSHSNLHSHPHSHSCSHSHISKESPNKSSTVISNTIINNDTNNIEKFNNTNNILSNKKSYEFLNSNKNNNIQLKKESNKFASCNAIQNKIDYNLIISKNKNSNAQTTKSESIVEGYVSKNDFNKQNYEKNNLDKDIASNDGIENNLTLPKIKLINDSYSNIHDKRTLFSPELKNKNINLLSLKNINTSTIKKSIQNIFKKSNPKENKENRIFSNIKLIKKESPLQSIDLDNINEVKMFPSNSKKGLSNLRLKLINSTHENEHQKMSEDNKYRSITISNDNTIKSIDVNSANKLLYSLKKIKPNYKLKLYDTYKAKGNEEDNLESKEKDNSEFNPFVTRLVKRKSSRFKKSRILQKEK